MGTSKQCVNYHLKPKTILNHPQANILVSDDGTAQINDFGISQIMGVRGFTTRALRNIRHNAPEVLPINEVECDVRPTTQSDMYSFGILLLLVSLVICFNYSCLTIIVQLFHGPDRDAQRALPYNHIRLTNGTGRELRLLRLIHRGERPIRDRYNSITDHHWNIIVRCWDSNPNARPTISEVYTYL